MNKVIIAVLAACAVIGAVWILCADCHAEDYAEQMSELAKEICKHQRGKRSPVDIADEIADVQIMLEQATMIFGVDDLVREHIDAKIARLEERVRQNMSN